MKHVDRRTVLSGMASVGASTLTNETTNDQTDIFTPQDEQNAESQEEGDWNSLSEDHLTLKFYDGYREDAKKVAGYYSDAEKHGEDVFPEDISIYLDTTIYIYPEDKWIRSDYSLYWTGTPKEVNLQAPSDSPANERFQRTGLGHELYNIILWNHYKEADISSHGYYKRNPSWFAEGISEYVTNRQPETIDGHPNDSVERKKEQIKSGDGYFHLVSSDRYHGGHLICEFLLDRYSYRQMFDVLANDSETWSKAFKQEFGMDQFELSLSWLVWAQENIGGQYLQGLTGATNALRTGDVDTELLRDVMDTWESGEPFE